MSYRYHLTPIIAQKVNNLPQTAKEEAEVVEDEVNNQMDPNNPCAKKIKKELEGYKNMKQKEFDDLYNNAVEHCE